MFALRLICTPQGNKEWDKGWMLLLQAIMRRRSKEWYTDPARHGGKYVPDAPTLESRLRLARSMKDCRRWVSLSLRDCIACCSIALPCLQ